MRSLSKGLTVVLQPSGGVPINGRIAKDCEVRGGLVSYEVNDALWGIALLNNSTSAKAPNTHCDFTAL